MEKRAFTVDAVHKRDLSLEEEIKGEIIESNLGVTFNRNMSLGSGGDKNRSSNRIAIIK